MTEKSQTFLVHTDVYLWCKDWKIIFRKGLVLSLLPVSIALFRGSRISAPALESKLDTGKCSTSANSNLSISLQQQNKLHGFEKLEFWKCCFLVKCTSGNLECMYYQGSRKTRQILWISKALKPARINIACLLDWKLFITTQIKTTHSLTIDELVYYHLVAKRTEEVVRKYLISFSFFPQQTRIALEI